MVAIVYLGVSAAIVYYTAYHPPIPSFPGWLTGLILGVAPLVIFQAMLSIWSIVTGRKDNKELGEKLDRLVVTIDEETNSIRELVDEIRADRAERKAANAQRDAPTKSP